MKVVLIKWKSRWEDFEEMVGIAVNMKAAEQHAAELAEKYRDCYGKQHGTWGFEEFTLIGDNQ